MNKETKSIKSFHSIDDPEAMWVLASPVRVDVLGAINAIGLCSVADIAKYTGRSRTSLYPHIEQLLRVCLIIEGEVRLAGKRYEQMYEPIARIVMTEVRVDDPENVAYHQAKGKALARLMARKYERSVADPQAVVHGSNRDTHTGFYAVWVNDESLKEMNDHIDAIRKLSAESRPGEGRRLVNVGIFMSNHQERT